MKTLTLRLDENNSNELEKIKLFTCEKTSTKTINVIISSFMDLLEERKQLQKEISKLLEENRLNNQIISDLETVSRMVLDKVSQDDLF